MGKVLDSVLCFVVCAVPAAAALSQPGDVAQADERSITIETQTEPGAGAETTTEDGAETDAGRETDAATETSGGAELLDAFLDEVMTLQAEFEQTVFGADGQLIELQSGWLAMERPNRFHWHYREPFEQLHIADGKNSWTYDVELEQVTATPMDHDATTSTPAMLLSGDLTAREAFDVVDTFSRDGLSWVHLEPDLEGADFSSMLIGFDEDRVPRQLELEDALNQTTRVELHDVVLNDELDEELFEFEPPPGVDVLGTPAD